MDAVWRWMRGQVRGMEQPQIMNLFGYIGVGTLAMSAEDAQMVHVDASKKSVQAARANAELSGLADRLTRWIGDDTAQLVDRDVRQGRREDGLFLDPPQSCH